MPSRIQLRVQRDVQFLGKLLGVKRAASKVAAAYLQSRDFAQAIVGLENDFLRRLFLLDVDLAESDASFSQESLCVAAIRAPTRRVHSDGFHCVAINLDERTRA